jgi:DNA-binding transcriptional regulator YiaG
MALKCFGYCRLEISILARGMLTCCALSDCQQKRQQRCSRDKDAAQRLLQARNDSESQPHFHLALARGLHEWLRSETGRPHQMIYSLDSISCWGLHTRPPPAGYGCSMQPLQFNNIMRFLALRPVQIKVRRQTYPRYWKSNQRLIARPKSIGEQIRKHRLESHLSQADVARMLEATAVSISNWERGNTTPSQRTRRKIQHFLDHSSSLVPNGRITAAGCRECAFAGTNGQLCLFEKLCK